MPLFHTWATDYQGDFYVVLFNWRDSFNEADTYIYVTRGFTNFEQYVGDPVLTLDGNDFWADHFGFTGGRPLTYFADQDRYVRMRRYGKMPDDVNDPVTSLWIRMIKQCSGLAPYN